MKHMGKGFQDIKDLANSKLPIIWVLGGPGSGKGTQCKRLATRYGYIHVSTGDLLHDEVVSGSPLGLQIKEIMNKGLLVPTDIVLNLIKTKMLKDSTFAKGYLIDGFPREIEQGIEFEKKVARCSLILYYDCSDEESKKRLLSRRASQFRRFDDNAETITLRLQTFHTHTEPLASHFSEKLVRIDAKADKETVFKVSVAHIDEMLVRARLQEEQKTITCNGCFCWGRKNQEEEYEMHEITDLANSKLPIIWVLGGPGSGKGTQCKRLAARYGYIHVSTGDLLHDEVISGSPLGMEIKEIMNKGTLVTTDIVLNIIKNKMIKDSKYAKGYLIDGFPREIEQGTQFELKVARCSLILYYDCPDEESKKRLMAQGAHSKRFDDNEETIKLRIQTFHTHTEPLLSYFSPKLVRIDAKSDPDTVFKVSVVYVDKMLVDAGIPLPN